MKEAIKIVEREKAKVWKAYTLHKIETQEFLFCLKVLNDILNRLFEKAYTILLNGDRGFYDF